jgi:SAM-dependent methyltransferase
MGALRKVDASLRTRRWIEAFTGAVHALHEALWLGLLDRPELNVVTERYYGRSPSHLTESHNLSGLFPWEQAAIEEFFTGCASILVAAAGSGREAIALCRRGFQADSFECNPNLVRFGQELSKRHALRGRVFEARPDEVPDGVGVYDGCIVGFGAYMHVAGRAARVRFLAALRAHLRPGGPLLVSFPIRGASRRDRCVAAIASGIRRLRGIAEAIEVGDGLLGPFAHAFTPDEIRRELHDAGFDVVAFREQPYGHAVARHGSLEVGR